MGVLQYLNGVEIVESLPLKKSGLFSVGANADFAREFFRSEYSTSRLVRTIRGQNCVDLKGLFAEFAASLQFPIYFGNNLHALKDCLTDLSWLGDLQHDTFSFLITESEKLGSGCEEGELVVLALKLADAVAFWNGEKHDETDQEVSLQIVLLTGSVGKTV